MDKQIQQKKTGDIAKDLEAYRASKAVTTTGKKTGDIAKDLEAYRASKTAPAQIQEQPKKSFMEKTGDVLNTLFGGKKIGEAIGTQIAKAQATPSERQYIEGPKASEVLGDIGRVGLTFAPVGAITKAATAGLKSIPLIGRVAKPLAGIGTGAVVGYGADVTTGLAEGEEKPFSLGLGTGIGTAIGAAPIVGKGLAKLSTETLGLSTGTGAGTIKTFASAIRSGGEKARVAREALRGQLDPQELVDEARGALGTIVQNRSADYVRQLSKLKTKTNFVGHTPLVAKFNKQLEDFGVFFNSDGTPNFSRSPGLGRYEKDLMGLSKTLSEWGTREGDNSIAGIDKLKQVIDDFRVGSADSKKFDTFVSTLRSGAKDLIKQNFIKQKDLKGLNQYTKMLEDYEKSTKDIKEIQKALSLGDKASADTAFRKLSTILRTNNEFRKKAIEELEEITGGTLLPKIAGQQLSELLPRGLQKVISGAGLTAGAFSFGIIPMLKLALLSSPRVIGEILNILGIVGNKADLVINALLKSGAVTPGDYLLERSQILNKPSTIKKASQYGIKLPKPTKSKVNSATAKKSDGPKSIGTLKTPSNQKANGLSTPPKK